MLKAGAWAVCVVLLGAAPVTAGQNSAGKLAMHLVASEQYLYCSDLLPPSCEEINCDLSAAELEASNGYGYLAFIAYDVTAVKGVEFAVAGFPTGRGGPILQGPYWCPSGTLTMGDFLDEGGIVSGDCIEPDPVSGLAVLGYLSFRYTGQDPLYIEYAPSAYSRPLDPWNYFLDCTIDYQEDDVTYETGCVIKGEALDGPLCGGESMGGGEGGGLVWSMCLEPADRELWDLVAREYLGDDGYLLPGREFPLPSIGHYWNAFEGHEGVLPPSRRFPISFFQFIKRGEPLYTLEDEGGIAVIDREWYLGFLPANPDGTLPEEGIDWWSWEHGRPVAPEKWVQPGFQWNDLPSGIALSFSAGRLGFQGPDGAEASLELPFDRAYVAAFDRTSRRVAVVGYDQASSEWRLSVLGERGTVIFEDPWDVAPSTHLHAADDGSSLLYAIWEDETTATRRPHIHPIPSGQPRRPAHPRDHPTLGVYNVSLRTGEVAKERGLRSVPPATYDPSTRESLTYSKDSRYVLRVGQEGARANVVAFHDASNGDAPTLLWERWENRTVQHCAVSPGGAYVAEIMSGGYWPEGREGPRYSDFGTTVLKLTTRDGHVVGTQAYSEEWQVYRHAAMFVGPYLFVGYDGSGYYAQCIYLYDMRVPWTGN